jgi:putative metal-binding protein
MRRALVLLTMCLLSIAAPPALAAPANDDLGDAEYVAMNDFTIGTNAGAGIQGGEPLTTQDTRYCNPGGGASLSGMPMRSTIWYWVEGTGKTLTLSAFGGGVNSVLAVYAITPSDTLSFIRCSDDVLDDDEFRWSALRFASQLDEPYVVQVGSRCATFACTSALGEGAIFTDVATQPDDDDWQHASQIRLGEQNSESLAGATEQGGELLDCGDSPYGKTRWFRVAVPGRGTLTVSASSPDHDSVLGIYTNDRGSRLDCNDDSGGSSSSARVSANVDAGSYLVQVGGYGPGVVADSDASFVLAADFKPIGVVDADRDGSSSDTDCDESNPAVHPGAPEIADNGIDDDCNKSQARDADRDGVVGAPEGSDCNDGNAQIKPGVRDVPANGVDENCDGADGKRDKVRAQPKFRYQFQKRPPRLKVVEAWVEDLQAGSKVTLRCSGAGCPTRRTVSKTVRKDTKSLKLGVRFKHQLKRSASITLTITHGDDIGTVRRLVVGNRKLEDRTLCLTPGENRARKCG